MAGNSLGRLVVSLGLNAAEFVDGLTKSEYQAQKFVKNMEAQARKIGAALGINATAVGTALFLMTKNAIDAADRLNDLSKSTGISVDVLGGLGFAAKQSGTDIDGVARATKVLNIQLGAAAAGSEDSLAAFKALGISVRDAGGNVKGAGAALVEIATKFEQYADGPNKAALANKFFGRTHQEMIPLLDEGGEKLQANIDYFKKYGGVNKETADRADEFNDTLTKLNLLSGAFARNLAAALLPSLQALANEFVATKEKGDGFKSGAQDLAEILKATAVAAVYVASGFQQAGTAIGGVAAAIAALARGDAKASSFILGEANKDVDALVERRDKLIAAIRNTTAVVAANQTAPKPKREAPGLPDAGAEAAAKKLLDGQLKALERSIREEQDILRDRNHFLTAYYQDDLISIADYYARRQAAQDEATRKQTRALDDEIAALKKFAATAKPADRIEAENKIEEAIDKRSKVERDAAIAGIDNYIEQGRAVRQFADSVEQAAIAVANARGDTVGAGVAAFDAQNRALRQRIELEKQSTDEVVRANAIRGGAALDELRQRTINQLALSKATQDYALSVDEVAIAQARLDNAVTAGSLTELEFLRKKSDLAAAYIPQLQAELAAVEAIARASGRREDLVRVEQLKVQLEALAAQGDLVAKKFNDVFGSSFENAFADFISGTKSAKDAFKSFANAIQQDLSRIVAAQLRGALFGGNGPLSGIGGIFGSIFGGGGGLFGANAANAYAAAIVPGFAGGTDFHSGGLALVGERGPELVNLPRGAQVIPNDALRSGRAGGGLTLHQTINVLPGASRATAEQAALSSARAARDAVTRFG